MSLRDPVPEIDRFFTATNATDTLTLSGSLQDIPITQFDNHTGWNASNDIDALVTLGGGSPNVYLEVVRDGYWMISVKVLWQKITANALTNVLAIPQAYQSSSWTNLNAMTLAQHLRNSNTYGSASVTKPLYFFAGDRLRVRTYYITGSNIQIPANGLCISGWWMDGGSRVPSQPI